MVKMMSQILVVEDESAIAELIALNLRHAGFEVTLAADAAQAQAAVDAVLPDLVLLDWMLPGQSGVALARQWRSASAHQRAAGHPADGPRRREPTRWRASMPGRRLHHQALLDQRVAGPHPRRAAAQGARGTGHRRDRGPAALDPGTRRVSRDGQEVKVGPTEFRLLHFFMTHPERVHSRAQLLDRVWGDHVFIEERTVDVHIKRLREALEPVQCARLIETVRGAGYRLTEHAAALSA